MPCGDRAGAAIRWAGAFAAAILTLDLLGHGCVHAVELRLPDGGVSLTGSLAAWEVFRLDPDTPSERPSAVLDLRLDAVRTDRIRLVTAVRGGFDGKIGAPHRGNPVLDLDEVYQSKDLFLSFDEAYLELYYQNIELRLGKQKVSWGQLDDLQPTDHLNPEDLTEFYFRPELERKIGVPGIRVLGYRGSWTVDFVWNPIFTAYRFPARDDRWFPPLLMVSDTLETPLGTIPVRTRYPDVDEPPHTLASSDVALRVRRFYEGAAMSLSVFHGWDKSPSFAAHGTATVTPTGDPQAPVSTVSDVAIRPSLHRITVVGADLAIPILWFALRAEAAWIHGRAFPLLLQDAAHDPQLLGVVGAAAERVARSGSAETVDLPLAPIELEREALQYGVGLDWFVTESVSRRLVGSEARVDPDVTITGDDVHHLLQGLALEPLAGEDLPHLLAFALGDLVDVPGLVSPRLLDRLALGPGGLVVADRHAEAVREQVGDAKHDDHDAGEPSARSAGDDREGGDASVDPAEDGVAEVAVPRFLGEPAPDCLRLVASEELALSGIDHDREEADYVFARTESNLGASQTASGAARER